MDRRAGELQDATPESASSQVKVTVTFPLFHPLALGLGLAEPVIMGGVRSMLTGPTMADAELPALSEQVPVTDWPAPSPVRAVGALYVFTPDRRSVQTNVTVTVPLFQPLAFAPGEREPVMLGGVVSTLTPATVAVAMFPALSVQVALRDWPAPSVEITWGVTGAVTTPDNGSVQVKETVTGALFHP